jgi:hypothetical protein
MIEQLPPLTPDAGRLARTMGRCHHRLARRSARSRAAARFAIERNALLGFGAVYLSSLALDMIRVLGW